ncbi:glycosyltransferase [Urechidicola sp. KH5]
MLPYLLWQSPKVLRAINSERKRVSEFHAKYNFAGIISDNRYGVYHPDTPSVFVSHQLELPNKIASKIQSRYIHQFHEIWIPDVKEKVLSGNLSNCRYNTNVKFLGVLSRFQKKQLEQNIEVLVVLSGLEPLRTQMEDKLLQELSKFKGSVTLVRGVVESKQSNEVYNRITRINYCTTEQLDELVNHANLVIARSGYSTILDLAKLEKRAFFIPTKGQPEQQYLAKHLEEINIAPYCQLKDFKVELFKELKNYTGFKKLNTALPEELFHLFERE